MIGLKDPVLENLLQKVADKTLKLQHAAITATNLKRKLDLMKKIHAKTKASIQEIKEFLPQDMNLSPQVDNVSIYSDAIRRRDKDDDQEVESELGQKEM